ncbi:universal stress protein uspa-like protein [Halogeometricum borinquense DSM 11551]|uniref:Universal stress protein UspA-like protein n=2 Tax=Halogeometricum borinquense TaxID=60847 RepID=E4NL62_HALBP|nr:universal stress protein [Halogeometricum borinquense]ADQ68311.1 universal stress protein UspA-like protein [Halogeometricum borinquense DSM 11551]ELY24647.1 universal stress protein uspa-like protein [Halogeometricum borinquense DSM 11551]RYJ12803.1 universal stress protein [Halogeometricum borinquense]
MHYVVAVDGSEPGEKALDHALLLTTRLDASLTVVYSVEPRVVAEDGNDMYQEDPDAAGDRGDKLLEAAAERAAEQGVPVSTALLWGDPAETIPSYVAENDVDGIIVGHRGLSQRVEGMVGSVAKSLVQNATVPVTIVS